VRRRALQNLRVRRDGLTPESRERLDRKLKEVERRELRAGSLLGRLKRALTPRDWGDSDLEDFASGRILVVGCGIGVESLALGAVGVDIDLACLRTAGDLCRNLEAGTGTVLAGDGCRLPFLGAAFDTVLSDNVVEHIPGANLPSHFREVFRVLRPGGRYAFHTPNGTYENPPHHADHISLHSYAGWERICLDAGFVAPLTPRRRSGPLVPLDWKKDYERGADPRRRPMGTSQRGVRMVTIVVRKP
jgi:SAM-dependent methyltransferase